MTDLTPPGYTEDTSRTGDTPRCELCRYYSSKSLFPDGMSAGKCFGWRCGTKWVYSQGLCREGFRRDIEESENAEDR